MGDPGAPTASDDEFAAALEAVRAGDPQRAVGLVRHQLLLHPQVPAPDVMAAIAEAAGADLLTDSSRALAAAPGDDQAMFDYGSALRAVGLPDLAVPVFRAMLEQFPGNYQLLTELVGCLDDDARHDESLDLLQRDREATAGPYPLESLVVFEAVLAGELETARDAFASLPAAGDIDDVQRRARVQSMLRRADAVADVARLDDGDLRGWHFVITGGLLTGLSPYGLDEEMKGRSALLYDSYATVHEGLRRARAVLESWGHAPSRILGLPDRDSQAVAIAAARLFDVEMAQWQPGSDERGLIVGYDLVTLDPATLDTLAEHRSGQALYVHAAKWTAPPGVAPDIVSVLYQHLVQPWGERMRMKMDDAAKPTVENIAPDTSAADILAEHIGAADPADALIAQVDSVEQLVAYAQPLRGVAAATQETGRREPFWRGSPVMTNRFA